MLSPCVAVCLHLQTFTVHISLRERLPQSFLIYFVIKLPTWAVEFSYSE